MDDPSVDTSSIEKQEILTKLGLNKSKGNLTQLRIQLRNRTMKTHPIKKFLNQLDKNIVQDIYKKISSTCNIKFYERKVIGV